MDASGQPPGGERPPDLRQGPSAATLIVIAAIFIFGGYFLMVKLRDAGRLQDCVMSGRSNCAPIEVGR